MTRLAPLWLMVLLGACTSRSEIIPGVSLDLAKERKSTIDSVRYQLSFTIPERKEEAIEGKLVLSFVAREHLSDLILDFVSTTPVHGVRIPGSDVPFDTINTHLRIDHSFDIGRHTLEIDFRAGDLSLNRNEDYMYTLFVPARASTAFPCFDQPNLKAIFDLTLDLPESWTGLSNGPLTSNTLSADAQRRILEFEPTRPISTYLFAFAAGTFRETQHRIGDRTMRMLYRESDSLKVLRNAPEVFRLHSNALDWMESYTQIDYPFQKFDFALIPTFQYGGMEHPGAIFYRESTLFLNESATLNDKLRRAGLISHETAHIWFGDLVTMQWFDDVWAKEVFANFMADKIVNPNFPWIHHDLKFLMRHHPAAYAVDRTAGANAIKQPLRNLSEAGMLYGGIIYNKAPIMMRHLEQMLGEDDFREGMRTYLRDHRYGNADWRDLVSILNTYTHTDLDGWSRSWIESPGMPVYTYDREQNTIRQSSSLEDGSLWVQELHPLTWTNGQVSSTEVTISGPDAEMAADGDLVLLNGKGTEYGGFIFDAQSISTLSRSIHTIPDRYLKGKIWLNMYETFLHGHISSQEYLNILMKATLTETDPQLVDHLLSRIRTVYWKFMDSATRAGQASNVEKMLWDLIVHSRQSDLKTMYFRTYTNIASTPDALHRLFQIWNGEIAVEDLPLGESEYIDLALELSVKKYDQGDVIVALQLDRTQNPDRKRRLAFLAPAVDARADVRDAFFASLLEPANRENEPWVVSALYFLHHPNHAQSGLAYLRQSLEILPEIQQTGDIFFPKRWLDGTFSGHNSAQAEAIINAFLRDHPDLSDQLRMKLLQSADMVYRARAIIGNASQL